MSRRVLSADSTSDFTSRSSRTVFTKDLVRVFIYQDNGSVNGKQPLFDTHKHSKEKRSKTSETNSSKLHRTRTTSSSSVKQMQASTSSLSGKYAGKEETQEKRTHKHVDSQLLDMVFGKAPISTGITFKTHYLMSRNQIMFSCVFHNTFRTVENILVEEPSLPVANAIILDASPKERRKRSASVNPISTEALNLLSSQTSINNSPSTPVSPKLRRTTSKYEGSNPVENIEIRESVQQKTNIGVVILFDILPNSSAVQEVFSSHFIIIKYRLRLLSQIIHEQIQKIQKLIHARQSFDAPPPDIVAKGKRFSSMPHGFTNSNHSSILSSLQKDHVIINAVEDFQKCICSFMTYPRLQPPAWVDIISLSESRSTIVDQLLKEITVLSNAFETPAGNFLLSRALTSILAYHCSWVETVSQSTTQNTSNLHPIASKLCHIFGCFKEPRRLCRVIVVGENKKLVCSFLFVLSFFIRGNALCNRTFKFAENFFNLVAKQSAHLGPNVQVTASDSANSEDSATEFTNHFEGIDPLEDPVLHLQVVESVPFHWSLCPPTSRNPYNNLGRSLYGSYCNTYASEFVLMGLPPDPINTAPTLEQLLARDLWGQCKFWPSSPTISPPAHTNSRSFHLHSASCIVIDTSKRKCKVFSFEPHTKENVLLFSKQKSPHAHFYRRKMEQSSIIFDCLRTIVKMNQMELPQECCVNYLEDTLSQIVAQSQLIRKFVTSENQNKQPYTCTQLSSLFQQSRSDMELFSVLQRNVFDELDDSLPYLIDPS